MDPQTHDCSLPSDDFRWLTESLLQEATMAAGEELHQDQVGGEHQEDHQGHGDDLRVQEMRKARERMRAARPSSDKIRAMPATLARRIRSTFTSS